MAGFFLFLRRVYKIELLGALFAPVLVLNANRGAGRSGSNPTPAARPAELLAAHSYNLRLHRERRLLFRVPRLHCLPVHRAGHKEEADTRRLGPFSSWKCSTGLITNACLRVSVPDDRHHHRRHLGRDGLGLVLELGPKETWSLITWIMYAILIHNRLAIGWRGRKTAYMMIAGFVSVVVTFIGVNLFIGGLHAYI